MLRRHLASPRMRLGISMSGAVSDGRNHSALPQRRGQGGRAQHVTAVVPDLLRPDRRMLTRLLACAVLALLLALQALAQSHSSFPVDIIAGPAPQPLMVDGRIRLAYQTSAPDEANAALVVALVGAGAVVLGLEPVPRSLRRIYLETLGEAMHVDRGHNLSA